MKKKCTKCNLIKEFTEFGLKKSSKSGLESRCKSCRAKVERTHKYNITENEIEQLAAKQQHCCAICNKPETSLNNKRTIVQNLAIDHCHKTGKVRGLLCSNCNIAIGKFKEDIDLLNSAIKYLKNNKTES